MELGLVLFFLLPGVLYVASAFVQLPEILMNFLRLPRFILILPGKYLSNPKVIQTVRVLIGLFFIGMGLFIE